ncbi:MAG: phage portal protein [Lysinibacillus sp.]
MKLFGRKKRSNEDALKNENTELKRTVQMLIGQTDEVGYVPLSKHPDVITIVNKIATLVSSMTIHLMQSTEKGNVRVKNGLSRKIDIEPCRNMTRKAWIYRIVRDMLLDGDGNSIVHIGMNDDGYIENLTPFQMQAVSYEEGKFASEYKINYGDQTYSPDEVLHFVLHPQPHHLWKGTGYRLSARQIVQTLAQADKTKNSFMSGKYMPSLILAVDAMVDEMSTPEGREKLLNKYVDETTDGKPWVLPADLAEVHQVKPLSLKDIAIVEGMELDKKSLAGLFGVPAFFVGVGEFNKDEYNNFINTSIMDIAQTIAQTLTRDILYDQSLFFRLNPRSLYSYDLVEMVSAGVQLVDRTALGRNELRDWIGMDPREDMEELITLENYIPAHMLGDQGKLKGGENSE